MLSDRPAEQVEEVFRYFNVVVSDSDYFTRCTECNGGSYLTVASEDLAEMRANLQAARDRRGGGGSAGAAAGRPPSDSDDEDDDYVFGDAAKDLAACDDDDLSPGGNPKKNEMVDN